MFQEKAATEATQKKKGKSFSASLLLIGGVQEVDDFDRWEKTNPTNGVVLVILLVLDSVGAGIDARAVPA